MTTQIQHFIDGRLSPLSSTRTADVFNPSTGEVQAQVLLASATDVDTRGGLGGRGAESLGRVQPATTPGC